MKIGDTEIEEIEEGLIEALLKMAAQGSVPAANVLHKILEEKRTLIFSQEHQIRVQKAKDSPIEFCEYMGEIGQSEYFIGEILGRKMTKKEEGIYNCGIRNRKMEIKAIELNQFRNGKIKRKSWM